MTSIKFCYYNDKYYDKLIAYYNDKYHDYIDYTDRYHDKIS